LAKLPGRGSVGKAGKPAGGFRRPREDRSLSAVFLVGFMGAGKTTVGRALARKMGWRFADLDRMVERREKRAVCEIFQDAGESAFRQAESAALEELLGGPASPRPLVAALGGGTLTVRVNRRLLAGAGGKVVFLQAPLEELRQRCLQAGGLRPLFRDRKDFARLYASRRAGYARADLTVDTYGRKPAEVAAQIAHRLGLVRSSKPARRLR